MFSIREITCPEEKSKICETILRALPDWFGIEPAIVEYVTGVRDMPFFAVCDGDANVGFVALKEHNPHTAEVYVMGVLQSHHRRGIGRLLLQHCKEACLEKGREFLTVKTLAPSHPDPGYARTRLFYEGMGFRPLEVFPMHWDEANPCLFMAMHVEV